MGSLKGSTYERGLTEVGDGVFAYLQPDGSWGWSNAGLVVGSGSSALIDTLFDLELTQHMLDEMRPLTDQTPIANLVNTHANGDHCYGNQLVAGPGVDVIASAATATEMTEVPPAMLAALMAAPNEGTMKAFLDHAFGPFEFEGIDPAEPTIEFRGHHELDAGGRQLDLIEVGPAHTDGDVIAWLPDERVLFAGDILFIEGTPIMWAGPVSGWIAALGTIIDLSPAAIVPGHGPLTDIDGVQALRRYFVLLDRLVTERHAGGLSVDEATRDIDAHLDHTEFSEWSDRERIVVNVQTIWKGLDAEFAAAGVVDVLQLMADNYTDRLAKR